MAKQPLAEVFGFPIDNVSSDADRYRKNKLCPLITKFLHVQKIKLKILSAFVASSTGIL